MSTTYPVLIHVTSEINTILQHRLDVLEESSMEELFYDEDNPKDYDALWAATETISASLGAIVGAGTLVIENEAQLDIVAELCEGCTYFGSYNQEDKPVYQRMQQFVQKLTNTSNRLVGLPPLAPKPKYPDQFQ